MIVVEFLPEHYKQIVAQPAQADLVGYMSNEDLDNYAKSNSFTGIKDGKPVICGGAIDVWPGRKIVWALLDSECGKYFVEVHRAVKRFFDTLDYSRIEAVVDREFLPGHRWVRSLGFDLEAPRMVAYLPNGRDASLYARVK